MGMGMNIDMDTLFTYRDHLVGRLYRHVSGELFRIKHITVDATDGKFRVVYVSEKHSYDVWDMPIDDFFSNVDKSQYPNATQEKLFEYIEEEIPF